MDDAHAEVQYSAEQAREADSYMNPNIADQGKAVDQILSTKQSDGETDDTIESTTNFPGMSKNGNGTAHCGTRSIDKNQDSEETRIDIKRDSQVICGAECLIEICNSPVITNKVEVNTSRAKDTN